MAFCSFSKDIQNTNKTIIDNLFIANYLPTAPENAVKVYLYGLYLCQNPNDINISNMAEELGLTINEVKDYFKYWEEYGLISIMTNEPFTINYLQVNDSTTNYKRFKPEKYEDFSKAVQVIISERMLSISELQEYFQLMENSALRPEALLMICKYCVDLKGANISYKYIIAVAKDFISRGITTTELVEKELSGYFVSSKEIAEILRALNVNRKIDVDDIKVYKKWTEKYCLDQSFILSVIKITKTKNFTKLDKIIDELYSNKCFTDIEAKEYFKNKENLLNIAKNINKTLGIYIEVLDNVVISYVSPWTAMGYNEDTLTFIANYCFRKNRRSLESMDETVKNLYNLGLLTTSNIADYIKNFTENDAFISKILSNVGVQRKPTDWDRDNLKLWRSWNFTDEVILEASLRASGTRNFVPYMTTILADWKSKDAFTLDKIHALPNNFTNSTSKKQSSHFENERTYTNEELNSLVDAFDDFKV
ncbi:MAG: DnaD domain protein [Clostridia bacterium]|nr:DnaD domain protein [Clostridia bacterium]